MMQPLYKKAETNALPEYQYMDIETLNWIRDNVQPEIRKTSCATIVREFGQLLIDVAFLIPKTEWYEDTRIANGIHGVLHAYRVTVYLLILNSIFCLNLDKEFLCTIGMFHDIGRKNDKDDAGHSGRSALWVRNNARMLEGHFRKNIERNLDDIVFVISMHDYVGPLKSISDVRTLNMINILKTADALDRYRLPKIKWWIKQEFLEIKPSLEIMAFAYNLIVYTEEKKIKSIDLNETIKCFLRI